MSKTIKVYCYKLTDVGCAETFAVVTDPSDSICVGGYDAQGKYQQFDSYEAYHVYKWAEQHGFLIEMKEKTIEW